MGRETYATYNYDAVGNLLSITRNTGDIGAPTITGLTPNTENAGASVNVSIAGTNRTGASVATNNPGILLRNVLTTPTSIAATFQMSLCPSPPAPVAGISLGDGYRLVGMTPDSLLSSIDRTSH